MPLGIRTDFRVARPFLHKADLILGRQNDTLKRKPLILHKSYGITRNGSCDGLGRQIEYPLGLAFSYRLHCREYRGDRLADTRGCLQKELAAVGYGVIHMRHQFLLPLPVRVRKRKRFNRSISPLLPLQIKPDKALISVHQVEKPLTQFII